MAAPQQNQSIYTNSFRLPTEKFPSSRVKQVVEELMQKKFEGAVYNEDTRVQVKELVDDIYRALNHGNEGSRNEGIVSKKFKVAVQVSLTERLGQALFSGSLCLWDPEHDNYVSATYETSTFTVITTVYGCLIE